MNFRQIIFTFLIVGVLSILWQSFYVVNQYERAVLLRFGELVRDDIPPGLGFKVPILHELRKFSGRIQIVDLLPQTYLTKEKEVLQVDSYVTWQVADAGVFYRKAGGNPRWLGDLLAARVDDTLRNQFGERGKWEAISDEREDIMDALPLTLNKQLIQALGVKVIDVRVKRIDLPDEASDSVYRRMRAERERLANEARAEGREISEKIRASADKQREILLAEAYREAEELRGAGDASATAIYADAYGSDPDFYALTRSLEAYRKAFARQEDVLLLSPDSDFFRFFKDPQGEVAP